MSDDPIKKCPECGKKVRRLIGGGLGVIFKGSGFYVTDNRGPSKAAADRHAPKSGDSNGDGAKQPEAAKAGSDSKSGDSSSKPKDSGKSSVKEPV
jgi:predicted nucleic acid-binding Zn ribbon protein